MKRLPSWAHQSYVHVILALKYSSKRSSQLSTRGTCIEAPASVVPNDFETSEPLCLTPTDALGGPDLMLTGADRTEVFASPDLTPSYCHYSIMLESNVACLDSTR